MNLATMQSGTFPQEPGINTTIYCKTNAGRLLAFEQKPSVPVALRDLLRRVDGKTSTDQLISQPGDAELFEQLCTRQLVRLATEPWRSSAHPPPLAPSVGQPHSVPVNHGPSLSLVSKLTSPRGDSKIEAIKVLMSEFIHVNLPEHLDARHAEINALANEAQLLCMLSGYIHLVDCAGHAGRQHVQDLLLILAGSE